jgi:hypothetical protein
VQAQSFAKAIRTDITTSLFMMPGPECRHFVICAYVMARSEV